MTRPKPKDLASSVRQRLLTFSQQQKLDYQLVLTRYGIERLLYRLSCSPERDRFVLKGAMLFLVWQGASPRPTRDIDLLGWGDPGPLQLRATFETLCRVEVEPDGLVFDPATIEIVPIRDEQAYGGQRVRLRASLGRARIDLQVDVGYGDAVFPLPNRIAFPTLLALPAPTLLTYHRETVIAEKFHALVNLGMANSRMKDFYDLALLAGQFDYEGINLSGAIRATFERRQTALPQAIPLALTETFYGDAGKQTLWRAFLARNGLEAGAMTLEQVVQLLREFVMPPAMAVKQGQAFDSQWIAGGPWERLAQ